MSRAAIAGDVAGSRFERSLWEGRSVSEARCVGADGADPRLDGRGETATDFQLFHPACFPTDDTVLTVAVMDWLLDGGDLRRYLRAWFRASPEPDLFGRFFRGWASADGDEPCGSVGNGAAMRVAPVAFAAGTESEAVELARQSALATHATEDGIAGAEAVALGVFLARTGCPRQRIIDTIAGRFRYDLSRPLDDWRIGYRFTSACERTVPIAFRAFLEADGHEAVIRAAISVGGDTDTIACMAGALAGAYWGIPRSTADLVADKLDPGLLAGVLRFEQRYPSALRVIAEPGAPADPGT